MKFNESRKFGVEIEVSRLNSQPRDLAAAITAAGVDCFLEPYNHITRRHWKIVTDASCGYELVSPPMIGEDGLRQIKIVCAVLDQAGAQVNRNCGLHVHHEVSDYSVEHFKRLVLLYHRFETVLDSLMPPSRRGRENTYCQPVSRTLNIDDVNIESNIVRRLEYLSSGTRYGKLSLASYPRYGTIEFRHHSGSTDVEKITNWVILTSALVDRALSTIKDASPEKNTWSNFQTVMGMYGSWVEDEYSKQAVKFYRKRRKDLSR